MDRIDDTDKSFDEGNDDMKTLSNGARSLCVVAMLVLTTGTLAMADTRLAMPHSHPHGAETHGFVLAVYYAGAALAAAGVYSALRRLARSRK